VTRVLKFEWFRSGAGVSPAPSVLLTEEIPGNCQRFYALDEVVVGGDAQGPTSGPPLLPADSPP
jgi:hypothetical protein